LDVTSSSLYNGEFSAWFRLLGYQSIYYKQKDHTATYIAI